MHKRHTSASVRGTVSRGNSSTRSGQKVKGASATLETKNHRHKDAAKPYGRAIITSAVNNTKAHKKYLAGLVAYAKHHQCPLFIGLMHYQNISMFRKEDPDEDIWWDSAVMPYAVTDAAHVGPILFLPNIRVQATTPRPLARKAPIGGPKWTVYCHPTTAMQLVPSPANRRPKRMYTTGVVTKPNYSRTESGAIAEFHHTYNALMVEWEGEHIWVRHLGARDDGVFCDLDLVIRGSVIGKAKPPAVVLSDEHVGEADALNIQGTFGPNGIVPRLKPKYLVRHDIFSGYSVNHHEFKQPFTRWQRVVAGQTDVRQELDNFCQYLVDTTPKGCTNLIAPSNHHDHLDAWVDNTDDHKDPSNLLIRAQLKAMRCLAARAGTDTRALVVYATASARLRELHVTWMTYDQDFMIQGIDVSNHGHVAGNGTRGSLRAFANLPRRTVTGHSHTPGIDKGAWAVGGMPERMGYERGYSSHDCSHVVIYEESGKRSMIDIVNGRCCLDWK